MLTKKIYVVWSDAEEAYLDSLHASLGSAIRALKRRVLIEGNIKPEITFFELNQEIECCEYIRNLIVAQAIYVYLKNDLKLKESEVK